MSQAAYLSAPAHIRKLFNQAFFKKLYIDDDSHLRSELAAPFDTLLSNHLRIAAEAIAQARPTAQTDWNPWQALLNDSDPEDGILEVAGLKERTMVGVAGIEPATPRV